MTVYYTKEKARFGGVTGTIIPFPMQLPAEPNPSSGNWNKYVPAGFLRCDGSILKVDDFPVLAEVLGIGNNCKFIKQGTTLEDDEFQLPDLGSKYVSGGSGSGAILNNTITNGPQAGNLRVGAETEITSLVGDTQSITYDGVFKLVKNSQDYTFVGNPFFNGLNEDDTTLTAFLGEQAWQAHTHNATVGVFTYLGNWLDSIFLPNDGNSLGGADGNTEGSNERVLVTPPTVSAAVSQHNHYIDLPSINEINAENTLSYNIDTDAGDVEISALGLTSTVTITTEAIYKLDEATPPFILVEYIIKI